jgi:hypothetical protein
MNDQTTRIEQLKRQLLRGLGVTLAITASGCCLEKTGEVCIDVAADEVCPAADEMWDEVSDEVEAIDPAVTYYPERTYYIGGQALRESAACCYDVSYGVECNAPSGFGRPYFDVGHGHEGDGRRATIRPATDARWAARLADVRARPERAARWAERGLMEHAAIASLGRFALELMAFGADPGLLTAALRAAQDEVQHAKLCFGLARAFGHRPVEPSVFAFGDATVPLAKTLAELAERTAIEGAVEETLGVMALGDELAHSDDPAERRVLRKIIMDEQRHALLAWRVLAWAVGRGGSDVAQAVRRALGQARSRWSSLMPEPELASRWSQVIEPCARTLC